MLGSVEKISKNIRKNIKISTPSAKFHVFQQLYYLHSISASIEIIKFSYENLMKLNPKQRKNSSL